jgi:hypothetical protein
VDTGDPKSFVGAFQQDHWSDGGARGIVAVSSTDGGATLTESAMPLSRCAPGGLPFDRAADPWVSMGPDGTVYAVAQVYDVHGGTHLAIGATVSSDFGRSWHYPTALTTETQAEFTDNKSSVTADPRVPGTAYAVWAHTDHSVPRGLFTAPTELSVTHDFGRTWSQPQVIVDTAALQSSGSDHIVVDPRTGELYDVFNLIQWADASGTVLRTADNVAISSTDGGRTWSRPSRIAADTAITDLDPRDKTVKITTLGTGYVQPAIDPATGTLYAVFEGTDFTNWAYNQVEVSSSTDHGHTWSTPELVSPPGVEAFDPFVAVNSAGDVAVSYYDLRSVAGSDPAGTLPTQAWLAVSARGGHTFNRERELASTFDLRATPGVFLGWYQGLAGSGQGFRTMFVTGDTAGTAGRAGVRTAEIAGDYDSVAGRGVVQVVGPRGPDPRAMTGATN